MLYTNCFYKIGDPIVTTGEMYHGELNINMSSIYTRLIQEAGRFCDHYASDLFIEYDSIKRSLDEHTTETRIIGFRDSGVDHTNWVCNKEPNNLKAEYRSIWKLDIEFLSDDYYDSQVKVTLQKVGYSISDHNFERAKRGET